MSSLVSESVHNSATDTHKYLCNTHYNRFETMLSSKGNSDPINVFFSLDVVWTSALQTGCQRPRRVSLRPELHPPQGGPLLREALPRGWRVLALQPSPASHQMPPQLHLPGQQLRQHHLHLQQGDHEPSELPRQRRGRS